MTEMTRYRQTTMPLAVSLAFGVFLLADRSLLGSDDFERAPINYTTAPADNAVSRLQSRIEDGSAKLTHGDRCGYLKSLLDELNVPVSSQTLVFSKTSLQRQRITPRTPRAIYFNDDVYVGFCQNGEVLELSASDPGLGTVFYTLEQQQTDKPRVQRHDDNCLVCHASSMTKNVPGHLVRSVYVDRIGLPVLSKGTFRVDHSTAIANRWGGWYVTGTHGNQSHLGNMTVSNSERDSAIDNTAGQNVTDLGTRFNTSKYLSPHSDLIALMVLEHQTEAHNFLTRASFQTREALYSESTLNKELGEPEGHRWQSTTTRIRSACESLVKYLLFCDEASLTSQLRGTTSFAEEFSQRGPRDSQGRSLRDFDLQRRLFKFPCSYLIYSRSFDELPDEAKELVFRRLWDVLSGTDKSREFAHLSDEDRTAIREILCETKSGLPAYWQTTR